MVYDTLLLAVYDFYSHNLLAKSSDMSMYIEIQANGQRERKILKSAADDEHYYYYLWAGELYTAYKIYYANDVIRDGYDNIIPHEEICTSRFLTYLMSHYYDGPNTAHLKPLRYIPAEHYEDDYLDYLENYNENFAETWC